MRRNAVAVVGAAETTELGVIPNMSQIQLHADAALNAIKDAGLKLSDIDGFATAVETTGHTLACCRITGVPGEDWRVRGAVANDGIGSVISAIFGGMALTSYSQNIGVISLTGVGSRFVVAAGGAFLIVMAMIPKVGAIIALMPSAVLGGVLLFMFGMVASVGLDIIGKNLKSRRDALIVASSLAVGLGIQAAPPAAFDAVAPALRILVTDGIVMGILLAMILNIVLPKETESRMAPAH